MTNFATAYHDKLVRALFLMACPGIGQRTLYVSGTGSDSNSGLTSTLPLRQITTALQSAQPGDMILVDNGTYAYVNCYGVNGSGDAWIAIMAKAGADPVISVADNSGDDGIDFQQSSFVGTYGLEIAGLQTSTSTNPSGIGVFRGSHHIRNWANHIHDFPGGGINHFWTVAVGAPYNIPAGGWDVCEAAFNTIHDCCRYSPNNTSAISFYGAVDLTGGATWDGRYGYRAFGNYIYDCECTVPYTPGGFSYVTDGNGLSFDSLYVTNSLESGVSAYTKRGLAEGNLIVGCGGRGLHIYNTINVDDRFNTYVGNLRTVSPAITDGVETDASYDTAPTGGNGVTHSGNVICPLNTPNTTDTVSAYTGNVILGGTQAVPAGNTDRRATGVAYFAGAPTAAQLLTGLIPSAFTPSLDDLVARAAGALGYQAAGAGGRAPSSWQAGALEAAVLHILI